MRRLLALLSTLCLTSLAVPAAPPERRDDEALPEGALVRLGHARIRFGRQLKFLAVSPDGKWITDGHTWFDVALGKEKPAPVHVPQGYRFRQWFEDGSYVVASEKGDHLL